MPGTTKPLRVATARVRAAEMCFTFAQFCSFVLHLKEDNPQTAVAETWNENFLNG
jgi:hypothetical protein